VRCRRLIDGLDRAQWSDGEQVCHLAEGPLHRLRRRRPAAHAGRPAGPPGFMERLRHSGGTPTYRRPCCVRPIQVRTLEPPMKDIAHLMAQGRERAPGSVGSKAAGPQPGCGPSGKLALRPPPATGSTCPVIRPAGSAARHREGPRCGRVPRDFGFRARKRVAEVALEPLGQAEDDRRRAKRSGCEAARWSAAVRGPGIAAQ
jgi:hypothetical protein